VFEMTWEPLKRNFEFVLLVSKHHLNTALECEVFRNSELSAAARTPL